ncbi:hypothetical protein Droror1_Dr00016625 [Drosera rotundifolia]
MEAQVSHSGFTTYTQYRHVMTIGHCETVSFIKPTSVNVKASRHGLVEARRGVSLCYRKFGWARMRVQCRKESLMLGEDGGKGGVGDWGRNVGRKKLAVFVSGGGSNFWMQYSFGSSLLRIFAVTRRFSSPVQAVLPPSLIFSGDLCATIAVPSSSPVAPRFPSRSYCKPEEESRGSVNSIIGDNPVSLAAAAASPPILAHFNVKASRHGLVEARRGVSLCYRKSGWGRMRVQCRKESLMLGEDGGKGGVGDWGRNVGRKKLAVFVSGEGSNFRVIHEATVGGEVNGDVVLVVTNKEGD